MSVVSAPLGDIADVIMGQSPPGDSVHRAPVGLPLLNGPTEFGQDHPEPAQWTTEASKMAIAGDILFCVRGSTTGRMNHADRGYAIGRGLAAIRGGDELESRYIGYTLEATMGSLLAGVTGSTFPNLSRQQICSHRVPTPSRPERRAIAEVLGALDDKIVANRTTESRSESLIRAYFDRAVVNGTRRPLFEVFEVDFGEAFKGDAFVGPGSGRPLVRIRDLKTFRPQVWTTESRRREVCVMPGDVVVGMDAEFRATWWLGQAGLMNQRVCRVRGIGCGSAYVAEALRAPLEGIESEKSGTTVIHLNKSDLERTAVLYPGANQLRRFEATAEPLLAARVVLAHEREVLTETRDELLPLLMSGTIRVRDAEKVVEGVV